ncbi:MAG TPA: response regulator transcription factor, partial [Candidatus Limnocylindria bacterium]|nr:response regulator transcription factor [Candidatus Limnocylindria bacterium]
DLAHRSALREAAELAPTDRPNRERARVLIELAYDAVDDGHPDEARRMAKDALDVARDANAATEEVRANIAVGVLSSESLDFQAADRAFTEAARVASEGSVTEEYVLATLAARRSGLAVDVGDYERALALVEVGMARAARAGTVDQQRPFLRWRRINSLQALGRWAEAEALVREGDRDSTVWQATWTMFFFLDTLIRQGRFAEADAAARRIGAGEDAGYWAPISLHGRAKVLYAEGRWAEASAAVEEAMKAPNCSNDVLFPLLEDSIRGEADRAVAAHARRRLADEGAARRIGLERLERLRALAGPVVASGGAGPRVEAVLATAEAEGSRLEGHSNPGQWDEVAGRWEKLQQPWETAYARFRQAETLLGQRGDRQVAIGALEVAHRLAADLGARPLLDHIEILARRARIRVVPATRASRRREALNAEGVLVSLTAREWEVLALVALGHTNREIGEQLFISEKTVSVHVTNAMNKLGALSRYEAAASASRLGLLPTSATPGHRAT